MDSTPGYSKRRGSCSEKPIHRFSKMQTEKEVPFFKYYNPLPDPVLKQEKRKMKATEFPIKKPKPKLRMKCITCKDKKTKDIEKEQRKIEKYIAPITRKQQRENDERHGKEKEKYFVCKKEIIRLPSPIEVVTPDYTKKRMEYESMANQVKTKVMPEKISMTESTLRWPPRAAPEDIASRVPKSAIIINKTKKKDTPPTFAYSADSIDFIYNARYREQHPWYEMYRGKDSMSFFPDAPAPSTVVVEEPEEEPAEEVEKVKEKEIVKKKKGEVTELSMDFNRKYEVVHVDQTPVVPEKKSSSNSGILSDKFNIKPKSVLHASVNVKDESVTELEVNPSELYEGYVGGEEDEVEFHPPSATSKISAATSIASEYKMRFPTDDQYDTGSLVPSVINRILQKYQRESEIELAKQEKQPFKKGTMKSHSTSKLPSVPKSFYFGVVEGSMHYGDSTFSDKSRYRQGLPCCITAYVMSFIIQPPRWKAKDIDLVLKLGDTLYLTSLEIKHLHETPRILQPEELYDVVDIGDKKIKYRIDEPDIAGFTRSLDPKIYNLLKGITLFFKRHRSGILQTYNTNILIFRQKHYYVFDPEPRSSELYTKETGKSTLSSFYDIPSVLLMLLDRGNIDNWPYIISKISIRRIVTVVDKNDHISLSSEYREESLYKIVNPYKAAVCGAFNIDDPCFGETRTKIAMAVATMAVVYSHVTPACAWHKKTVDKILMVANQFHIECLKDTNLTELKLENIPAFFTIGPLMIEITIYANQYAGLMFQKSFCLFSELITKFFCHNKSAIVEIDRFVLAIWKDRDVFYTFDPYSRDKEGLKIKDGVACVTMNVNVDSFVKTILYNFSVKDYIFKIHAVKIIRINRDPEFGKVPRNLINSEQSIIENIKVSDRRAFSPKNITVDKTEIAAKLTSLEEELDPSIIDIGSFVGSLDQRYVTDIPTCASKAIIKYSAPFEPKILDLDSPSLSETQIDKERPSPLRTDSFEFRLLDEILKEEMEINKLMELGEAGDHDYLKLVEEYGIETPIEMEDEIVQKGKDFGIIDKRTGVMNTDLLGLFPITKQVLEPNKPPRTKSRQPTTQARVVDIEPVITQSSELARPSNFITLPDGSQILYGTRNVANLDKDYDDASPFVAIVAIVMAKKYTLNTWSQEVIDAVLDYGCAVHKSIEIKFSDVPKIDIPKLTIGKDSFHVTVDYLFDSLLAQSILEQCLEKLVFRDKETSLVVTQNYSCAVFKKRCLYYMFDAYGNNLVGLGEGPDNTGIACMFRFKTLYALVSRLLYNKKQRENIEPVEATRFVISSVLVKVNFSPSLERIPRREKQLEGRKNDIKTDSEFASNPEVIEKEKKKEEENEIKAKNKIGYQKKDKYLVIEGSDVHTARDKGTGKIKACHFTCICAMIGIFGRPIKTWDTKRIDYVDKIGRTLFRYVDNFNFADKRNVTNLLIDKYFFDMVVKRITIADQRSCKHFSLALDHLLVKNKFLLMQFPNCCYTMYKGAKTIYHLFDPYGVNVKDTEPKTCWIKFPNRKLLLNYLKRLHKDNIDTYFFYTINISHIKKASKKSRLEYKLRVTQVKKQKKPKHIKVFHESENWLTEYPIPWSRMKKQLAAGVPRGTASHKWFSWDVEYPGDLYSMTATNHQCSPDFSAKSRNKQTISNCIVAIVMTEMYDFTEWNSQIMDSILIDGDQYFNDTINKITKSNYEIGVDDFPLNVNVFPYNVNIEIVPVIEGTMFLIRPTQFNLAKALRYFFEGLENRCGIICSNNGRSKTKYLAYGRVREDEYFMYDCQTIGPPMFVDRQSSKAYILRCVTLNRLIHCMTMTLRGGDFFIYSVAVAEEQDEQVVRVEDLEAESTATSPQIKQETRRAESPPTIKEEPEGESEVVIKTEPEDEGEVVIKTETDDGTVEETVVEIEVTEEKTVPGNIELEDDPEG